MGFLGFVFERKNCSKRFLVSFIEDSRLRGNFLIGDVKSFDSSDADFLFMNSFGDFEKFFVFDDVKFKYGKIRVHQKGIVSFEDFVFWFSAKNYREICEALVFDEFCFDFSSDDFYLDLKERVLFLMKFFLK